MKDKLIKALKLTALILSLLNGMIYYSMRPLWSGISETLGDTDNMSDFAMNAPILLFALFVVIFALTAVLFFALKKKHGWVYGLLPLHVLLFVALILAFTLGAPGYARFILFNLANITGIVLAILVVLFFIFLYPKTKLKDSKVFKFSLLGLVVLGVLFFLFNIKANTISYEPVVYAVEDEYQIVFSGNTPSQGWVKIDDMEFYDTYAGSQKSTERVHKITVPQEVLDEAKSYTIYQQNYIYRGPFAAIKGTTISKTYKFQPVNTKDGLNYYALSDIHMDTKGAANAMKGIEGIELLILNGDIISDVENFYDANYVNKIAFQLTKGGIPVVYARGNHETKGAYADQLYKFVGSRNENFYYNFYLDGVYGMVLDMGEDHDEGWWEYYGSDDFDHYRETQVSFIESELEIGDYKNYDYRLVVCHIPLAFINTRRDHVDIKTRLVALLNQMDVDMLLAGHQHELFIFEPGAVTCDPTEKYPLTWNKAFYADKKNKGYLLDFDFPSLMITKHGFTQTDKAQSLNARIGLSVSVDFESRTQTCFYQNSKQKKVYVVNPFAELSYGETFTIDLDTNAFSHVK